jgi:hypothetical protein
VFRSLLAQPGSPHTVATLADTPGLPPRTQNDEKIVSATQPGNAGFHNQCCQGPGYACSFLCTLIVYPPVRARAPLISPVFVPGDFSGYVPVHSYREPVIEEARGLKHDSIGTEYLLPGILRAGAGLAAKLKHG